MITIKDEMVCLDCQRGRPSRVTEPSYRWLGTYKGMPDVLLGLDKDLLCATHYLEYINRKHRAYHPDDFGPV